MTRETHVPRKLRVRIFADGADVAELVELAALELVRGFTTNPTLMRKAGVTDYESFVRDILRRVPDRPISFEVISDEFDEMERQALRLSRWGANVYVKIPVTNSRRESSVPLLKRLSDQNVRVNVTAVLSPQQVREVAGALASAPPSVISVFAGRIADSGRDPVPLMVECLEILKPYPQIELLWASPREVFNVIQADSIGCHIITLTTPLLKKLSGLDRGLEEISLDTVKMFLDDARASGIEL